LLVGVTDLLVEFPGEREVAGGRGDLDGRVVLLEAEGNVAALAGVAVHPDASYNNARAPLVSRSKEKVHMHSPTTEPTARSSDTKKLSAEPPVCR
jgi:hypothetical protein